MLFLDFDLLFQGFKGVMTELQKCIVSGWGTDLPKTECSYINEPAHEIMHSSSVNSFVKRTCAAIQWGYMSDFGLIFVWTLRLLPYFSDQRRLWRDCADAQVGLSVP